MEKRRTPKELDALVEEAKRLLVAEEKTPVREIAERLGLNPRYLSEAFKERTGFSPVNFRKKLGAGGNFAIAKNLLTSQASGRFDASLLEIAQFVFNDRKASVEELDALFGKHAEMGAAQWQAENCPRNESGLAAEPTGPVPEEGEPDDGDFEEEIGGDPDVDDPDAFEDLAELEDSVVRFDPLA